MISKNPPIGPNPSTFRKNVIRSDWISLFNSLHQSLIRYHSSLHLRPSSFTQLERSSPNLLISKDATFPNSILLAIFILVHPLLYPLAGESRVSFRIIVERFRLDAAEHQHLKPAVGVSAFMGNRDHILQLMMIYHEAVRRSIRFIVALVSTTSAFFSII